MGAGTRVGMGLEVRIGLGRIPNPIPHPIPHPIPSPTHRDAVIGVEGEALEPIERVPRCLEVTHLVRGRGRGKG